MIQPLKPKSSRKSRRPRIDVAFSSGSAKFEPSEDDWIAIEKAFGRSLPEPLRTKIASIVQSYFNRQPFEKNAPFLDDVLERIDQIKFASKSLRDTLQGPLQKENHDTNEIVRNQIGLNCAIPNIESSFDKIEHIESIVRSLIRATDEARQQFIDGADSGLVEGQRWHEMVGILRTLIRNHGLPPGASQDASKSKTGEGSPFVRFIQALQRIFPESLRRHHLGSAFALAKEINRSSRPGAT